MLLEAGSLARAARAPGLEMWTGVGAVLRTKQGAAALRGRGSSLETNRASFKPRGALLCFARCVAQPIFGARHGRRGARVGAVVVLRGGEGCGGLQHGALAPRNMA